MPRRTALGLLLALPFAVSACRPAPESAPASARPSPRSRGVVLISIDALRADSLGVYGSARPSSPTLDRLAERGVVFENAFSQIPSTLPSHLSMFTGLYPSEHGVLPPSGVLASQIQTLPELLRAAGVRTAGHSEGGYVQGGYGFARGFEEWSDTPYAHDADVERTFRRGLDSLAKIGPDERFFLFLHSYTVHDPYEPPDELLRAHWPGPPPEGAFAPTGRNFNEFNRGRLAAPAGSERYYRALYDASVESMDRALERFVAGLEALGLADDTTIVFTSDHGEEFLEHGRFVHTQTYPESLRIPLVVVPPGAARARRVRQVIETVDFLPTLVELLSAPVPPGLLGESFASLLAAGGERVAGRAFAQDEALDLSVRTVIVAVAGRLHQLAVGRPFRESDGVWATRELAFDAQPPALVFRAAAFHRARPVEVWIDGERGETLDVGTDWRSYEVALPPGPRKHRIRLRSAECEKPSDLGLGKDERCLSFKIQGLELTRIELYDLARDPLAGSDLSADRPDLVRVLARELADYPTAPRFAAGSSELTEEQIRELRALGYL